MEVEIVKPPRRINRRKSNFLSFVKQQIKSQELGIATGSATLNYGTRQIYIEFSHSCDRRFEMAKTLLNAYERSNYDGGEYRVLERNVDPERVKIRTGGSAYLDHYFPRRPPIKWEHLGTIPVPRSYDHNKRPTNR